MTPRPVAQRPAPDWRMPSDATAHASKQTWAMLVADSPRSSEHLAGEVAAWSRWRRFVDEDLQHYESTRNQLTPIQTSQLSAHLRWGEIHPNAMLRHLGRVDRTDAIAAFRRQLAWRDFLADVWDANPASFDHSLDQRFDTDMNWIEGSHADERFTAWQHGQTGFPLVDAGMRQLAETGWLPNRVRMVAASFLVKDLHVAWQRGARHFFDELVDGDPANNQQNWQWVAGSGNDAAPFFRVFNPTSQGQRFDPTGAYAHEWLPELRDVPGTKVYRMTAALRQDLAPDYPAEIVDHAAERAIALADFSVLPPRFS